MGGVRIGNEWHWDDGTVEPYNGQDGAAQTDTSSGGTTGGGAPTGGGTGEPKVGDVVHTSGGDLVFLGNDVTGQPRWQLAPPRTSVINGKLVDTTTGQVIGDYSNPSGGGGTGSAIQTALIQAQAQRDQLAAQQAQQAAVLAEQQRQYNETFGVNKAQYNITQQFNQAQADRLAAQHASDQAQQNAQFQAGQDLTRGNTLLGLGSRPETLARYLYALQGKQAPQGLGLTAPNLPGYPATPQTGVPIAAQPGVPALPGAAVGPSVSPFELAQVGANPTAAPLPSGGLTPLPFNPSPVQAQPPNYTGVANAGALLPSLQDPAHAAVGAGSRLLDPRVAALQAELTRAGANDQTLLANAQQFGLPTGGGGGGVVTYNNGIRNFERNNDPVDFRAFGDGGPIPEPVVGIGMHSGQRYIFGEKGPEHVVPGKGKDPRGDGSYAAGGTIGYDTSYYPGVFNPPSLQNIVSQGFNTPGVPLLPQVGAFTGGGQSLIPSAQTFFQSLPSERQAYSGFLQDEAGVQPGDVTALMQKLAPQGVSGLKTPRFAA